MDMNADGSGHVSCCTEYHKVDANGNRLISIRCHPNYRGTGHAWYDWAIIRFEDDSGASKDYPSRILSVISRPCSDSQEKVSFELVVQCCEKKTGRQSILYSEWIFSRDFYLISADAIVGLCFVIESDDRTVFVVEDRSNWASLFYDSASIKY